MPGKVSKKRKKEDKRVEIEKKRGRKPHALHNKEWLLPLVLFVVAFSFRLVFLLQVKDSPVYSPLVPGTDENSFYNLGIRIAQTGSVGSEPYTSPPLYAYFLGGLFKIFGIRLFVVQLVQILIGSSSCVLIYLITKRIFGRSAALIAGIISCFYGVFLFYEVSFLGSFLVIFLSLAALYIAVIAKQEKRHSFLLLSGLLLGLSALGRPNMLLVALGAVLALSMVERNERISALRNVLLFLAGMGVAVIPVTIRNYHTSGEVILITSHGGINFYLGNNSKATGTLWVPEESGATQKGALDYAKRVAQKNMGKDLSVSEISNYWYKRGLRFIIGHPLDYLRLVGQKIFYFWNAFEIPLDNNYYFARNYAALLKLPLFTFLLVSPLAMLGIVLTLIDKTHKGGEILFFFVLFYFVSVIIFYVTSRYRLPVVPVAIIFASYGLTKLYTELRGKNFGRLSIYGVILGILFFFTRPAPVAGNFDYAVSYYRLGNYYFDKGELYLAADEYKKALAIDGTLIECRMNLGSVYSELGKLDLAEKEYRKALALAPANIYLHNNLANVLSKKGQTTAAIAEYRQALAIDSSYAEAHNNLGALYLQQGETKKAMDEFKSALFFNNKFVAAYRNLGNVYLQLGEAEHAIAVYSKALQLQPDSPETLTRMGLAYLLQGSKKGRRDDLITAKDYLAESLSRDPSQAKVRSILTRIEMILSKSEK